MIGPIAEAIRRRREAAREGEDGPRRLSTWMNVFRADVTAKVPCDEAALCDMIGHGRYSCVGKSHSYNGVQIAPETNAMMMREGGLDTLEWRADYNGGGIARIGASVSIEELKRFLLGHGQRMLNSGNYMQQTVVGAALTGTHGYGEHPVMADGLETLTFLNDSGERVTLVKGSRDFALAAISFGTLAPVVEIELRTVPLTAYISTAHITRLSQKEALKEGSVAASWAAVPYSNADDPMIMLHTLHPDGWSEDFKGFKPPTFSFAALVNWALRHYWAVDRLYPSWRRKLQRFADGLDIRKQQRCRTDPEDLDYLYDPQPGLMQDRGPDFLRGVFSTTHTSYNLAFFVPLERAEAVVKFIMLEAENYRDLGFYLKSLIGVRELRGQSQLAFAATANGPVAAIDLFSDTRDYAWLERLQREVMAYEPRTRAHFGKSALGAHFRAALGEDNLDELFALHKRHFPGRRLIFSEPVRRLLDVGRPMAGNSAADAKLAALGKRASTATSPVKAA